MGGWGQKEGGISPELAPVTMTTVSRGSFTTGILGLDPILSLSPVMLSRHSTKRAAIFTEQKHP